MSTRVVRARRARATMLAAFAITAPMLMGVGPAAAHPAATHAAIARGAAAQAAVADAASARGAFDPGQPPSPMPAPMPGDTPPYGTPPDGTPPGVTPPDGTAPPSQGTDPDSTPRLNPDPTIDPTADPTADPTSDPTSDPTHEPSDPTDEPTDPTHGPTEPTHGPTEPTAEPTGATLGPSSTSAPAPPTTAPRRPTIVTLDFDGNTVDQVRAGSLLQSLGMRGVFYISSGRLDVGGDYMSTAQVRDLQARGHEIGGNTVSRVRLSSFETLEQQRQICGDRNRLLSSGLAASTFAYPYGDFDPAVQAAVNHCGYNNARAFGGLSCLGCAAAETVPPASSYATRSVSGIGRDTTAGQLVVAVQRAQATGGWLQIVFQRLCLASGCSSNGIQIGEFEAFARWLDGQRRQGGLSISTVHDVLGGRLRPAVAPPAATATRLRIANASFENGGAPDASQCFSMSTSGDGNLFTARRVSDRHSGRWAQEVAVTKVTGAVKLQSAQDLGSCAPPIVAQHKYRVSVWYKSTAPIMLAAYTRRPTGGYSSFGDSPAFAAAGQWTQAVWTTKGAPATSNLALSVGVVFKSAGTYLLDDFSIADAGLAAKAEAQVALVETDSREGYGGSEDLFVPSDTAPTIPAGPAAASLNASQRHGWLLTGEIVGALVLMWGVFAALDRRFRQIHRRTRTRGPAHRETA